MRRMLLLAVVAVAGCRSFEGPLAVRNKGKADAPGYTIEEQQKRGRARYPIPDDQWRVGPSTGLERPDPIGGGRAPGGGN